MVLSNQEINQKKLDLDNVYNLKSPELYYQFIDHYKYYLPEHAKPYFQKIIETYRQHKSKKKLKVLDVGCSYGVNAAILKFDKSISGIYQYYANLASGIQSMESACEYQDRDWFRQANVDDELDFIGLDAAENAVDYAIESQLIQSGISTNLEKSPLSAQDRANLQDLNLLISTGCIGYITEITFRKMLAAIEDAHQLWGAVFVLKMFDLAALEEELAKYDLMLVKTEVAVKQRKFSSTDEKESMIGFIEKQGLCANAEKESDHLFAQLFLILPRPLVSEPFIQKMLDELNEDS